MSTPRHAGAGITFPAADLDRRFYAFVLDRLLAWGLFAGVGYLAWTQLIADDRAAAGAAVIVGTVLVVSLAFAVALGIAGVSPGKAALGLRVVAAADGRPIGVPLALVRTAVLGFFTLPTAGLGLATLAWTAAMDPAGRRRGGHDRMTDAVVVDVRPVPTTTDAVDPRPRQIVNLTAMRLLPAATPASATGPVPTPTPTPTPGPAPRAPAAPTGPMPTQPPPAAPPPSRRPTSPPPSAAPAQPPTPAAPVRSPGRWRVAFDTGEEFVVEGLALVGRRPEARGDEPVRHVVPLRSSDMSVSKTHAQFQVVPDGALVVMDRGSTNGSVLVREGVSRPLPAGRPATLLDGDTVRFGDRSMIVTQENS